MRDISFRGKRIDNGEWVYGNLFVPDLENSPTEILVGTNVVRISYEVDPDTVGQYTGEDGENGPIYEGDIVEFFGMRGVVEQVHGAFGITTSKLIDYDLLESNIPFNNPANFCFNDNFISLWELWWNYEQDIYPLYEVKVIGNIYDNPELLKEGCE